MLAAGLLSVTAGGDAAPPAAPPASSAATAGVAHAAGGATIPRLPDDTKKYGYNPWQDAALPIDATQTVPKAKVRFRIPTIMARTYYVACLYGEDANDPSKADYTPDPCPFEGFDPPKARWSNWQWLSLLADAYFYSPAGRPYYGRIPPIKVSLLAFGSVPVTATVVLSQTVHGGYYDPLTLTWTQTVTTPGTGTVLSGFEKYGPAPNYGADEQAFFGTVPSIVGTLDVHVRDVVVDTVPINVGPDCRTATPAQIDLSAPAGWYPSTADPKSLRGKAGEFLPLNSGDAGYLQGKVDIPAFTGCRDGAGDLSPLLTSAVSGPGNPIETYSSIGLQPFCVVSPRLCPSGAAAAANARTAALRALVRARTPAARASALQRVNADAGPRRVRAPATTSP